MRSPLPLRPNAFPAAKNNPLRSCCMVRLSIPVADTVVLSHTLPNGLKLRLQLPDPAPTPRAREVDLPLSEKKSKKEKKEKKEKKNEKKRKSENEKEPPAQPKPVHAVLEQTSAPSAAAPAPSAWSQIGQAAASSRAAPSPTESGGKRRRRERKDWACPKCGTLCFEKKVTCFKCGTAKP